MGAWKNAENFGLELVVRRCIGGSGVAGGGTDS